MKRFNFHPTQLQSVYLVIYLVLFSLIIYIPTIVNGPIHLTQKLIFAEATIEGTLLGILFIISIWILNLYKQEVSRHKEQIKRINTDKSVIENRLNDSYRYIGLINVQIQEIKSIFNSIDKYPDTKEDFKKIYQFFGGRIHGIVQTDWVLFRIISCNSRRTVSEHFETRQGFSFKYPHVSNKLMLENQPGLPYISVISNPQNLNIQVCCVLPLEKISPDQRVFIQAIMNEITKLFVISNSAYYKKENKMMVG